MATAAVWGRAAPRLSSDLDAFAEGYVQDDTVHGLRADLTEAWVHGAAGPLEIKLGRQIQIWGRADQLNPTDNLSSRDYTLLVAEESEQRRGLAMADVRYGAGPWTLDAVWIPEFRPNQFPLNRRAPGVVIAPDQSPDGSGQYALKLDNSGGRIDWSVSWYDGFDHDRELALIGESSLGQLEVQQQFSHIQVIGGDLAVTLGPIGYRAETAYSHFPSRPTPFSLRDNVWLVAGGDMNVGAGWNLNLQYSYRALVGDGGPSPSPNPAVRAIAALSAALNNQSGPVQNGATFRVGKKWLNDTLSLSVSLLSYFESKDGVFRPQATYALTDNLKVSLGGDLLYGRRLSEFGYARTLSGAYVQLTAGF